MPKTVLISLAAVVALIVIVILLGIRYLRADDDDDFEEDVPAEHGRYPHDRARPRRDHDDMPHDRFKQRQRATSAGRALAARPAGRAPSRIADDRGWREESGHAAGRGLPQRDSRPGRSGGSRDRDDISEPAAASARRGYQGQDRAGARGAEDVDAWPGPSQSSARDYERDRSSQPSHRLNGGRQNGAASDQDELLPAIRPRQSRNKRDNDGDWPSNEWDELSDVDYWAELAADKPLTAPTPAQQASRPRRGSSRSDASEPALRDGDTSRAGRPPRERDAALQPDRAIVSTAARKLDPAPADRSEDPLGGGTRRSSLGRTEQMHALPPSPGMGRDGLQPGNPVRPDDDPLTSPSFPRVAADDSRSYRRSKRAGGDESEPGGRTRDGSTQPHSYPRPAGLPADNSAGYARAGTSAAYIGTDADPYAPVPNNGAVPGYPAVQGGSDGYAAAGGQSSGSYPGGGYAPPADFGQNGYQSASSATAGSYLPSAATGSGGYSGDTVVRGNYQPSAPDPASFRSPGADSGSYHSPPVSYPDAGVGGYLPAAAGYPISGDVAEFHADRADFASAYPSYGDPRPSAFPQPRPDPGYLPNAYGAGHDPGFHPSLPGHMEAEYSAYQAPVAPVNGSPYPYPPAGGQLPGPSAGYQDPYQAAPYDQAGYARPAAQRGYAGADPYAADPYGHTGYGNGGR